MTGEVTTGASGYDRLEQHLVAGGEMLRQDRVREARAEFLAALEIAPDDLKALGLLGLSCFRLAAFADALPVYQKLVALCPDDASYRLNLGLVYLKMGSASQAIDELSQCRALDPSQSRAVGYLGLAYARNGQYADAYLAFLQSGQVDLGREMEQYLGEEERAQIAAMAARSAPAEEVAATALADDDLEEVTDGSGGAPQDGAVAGGVVEGGAPAEEAAVEEPMEGPGVISRAVDEALPSAAATAAAARVAAGHRPPQALSEFATERLIRPEDGEHPFEISAAGVLIVKVRGRVFSRTEGVCVSGGELAYELATRRVRGSATGEPFGSDGRRLFIVSGQGHLIASPLGEHFTAVTLDDDIFYLREDLVFAFEEQVRWENGNIPGSESRVPIVQFRGHGSVALRTARPLVSVKLASERVLYVDARLLAGWIGRVVPRIVAPAAGGRTSTPFVECTGEGVVLLEEEQQTATDLDADPAVEDEREAEPDEPQKAAGTEPRDAAGADGRGS